MTGWARILKISTPSKDIELSVFRRKDDLGVKLTGGELVLTEKFKSRTIPHIFGLTSEDLRSLRDVLAQQEGL